MREVPHLKNIPNIRDWKSTDLTVKSTYIKLIQQYLIFKNGKPTLH